MTPDPLSTFHSAQRSIVKSYRWAAWLAVAIPIAVLFGPVLLTDRSFAFRDASHFYYPLFEWCAGEWGAGRVPLWNPYENAGIPALADTSSSLFYPGKLVFALPLDFALRYKLFVVGHVVLAAVGSYRLARAWSCSRPAAAMSAIAYACGGNVVFQYCNVVFLVGAAWLPFAALAVDRMLAGRSWRWSLALAAVLALMILGGDPQIALNVLLAAGLFAVILIFSRCDGGTTQESKSPSKWRLFGLHIVLLGLAAVAGFLLSAVQVLPSSEATSYSERAAFNRPRNIYEAARVLSAPGDQPQPLGETPVQSVARGLFGSPEAGSHHFLAYGFSVGPWRLAEYFFPNIGGRMLPTNRRWFSLIPAEMRTWTPTLYMGLVPILLGLAGLRLWRGTPRERWLTALAILGTLASFGWYGIGWVIHESYAAAGGDPAKLSIGQPVGGLYWLMMTFLPSYAYFRYPAKLLPFVALGLSQLAAIGWDRAFAERRVWLARTLLIFGSVSGIAAFVFWCGGTWFVIRSTKLDSSLGPFDGIGAYRDILAALVQAALVAFAVHYCLKRAWNEPARQLQWQLAALLLTAAELAVANYWLVPTAPASLWRDQPQVAQAIHAAEATDANGAHHSITPPRVSRGNLGRWRPTTFARQASVRRPTELAQWERDTLFPKHQLTSGLGLIESYGSVKLVDYESLMFIAWQHGQQQPDGQRVLAPTALRLLGTEFLALPESSQPKYATRIESPAEKAKGWPENTAVWRMSRTLPRAWIVHQVETLPPLPFPRRVEEVDTRTREVLYPGNRPRDFSVQAVVETTDPLPAVHAASPGTAESCQIVTYEPTRVVIEATLAQPGLIVLSDAWFPGWQATVRTNDSPNTESSAQHVPIHRTDRVLRGIWLPAGNQTLELHYRPVSFVRGAVISGASWAAVAMLGLAFLTLRRRGNGVP